MRCNPDFCGLIFPANSGTLELKKYKKKKIVKDLSQREFFNLKNIKLIRFFFYLLDRYIHQINSENPELHKSFEYQ